MYFREVIKRDILPEDLHFTAHFLKRQSQRPVSKEEVADYLINREFLYAQYQEESGAYKLIYRMSGKYHLIIVAAAGPEQIRIITIIKSNKKAEKLVSKKGFLVSSSARKG
ncbi:MAG: hypothetical protein JW727_01115 [Candidatus Aenigmarchaeota archaeon]|nr:hypothetical protein [Candidatus Aenigmarchaeota archaeon]